MGIRAAKRRKAATESVSQGFRLRYRLPGNRIHPRVFWVILSPVGLLLIPGLVHDFGYRFRYLLVEADDGEELKKYGEGEGRRFWDDLFRKVAVDVNGFKVINRVAWFFVRVFGGPAWRRREKESFQAVRGCGAASA